MASSKSLIIGLDFETYSATSLPDYGLDRYVNDLHFQPLIASTDENPATQAIDYDFILNDRDREYRHLQYNLSDKLIAAHNAGFERAVLHQMGIVLPGNRFVDSAVVSRAVGGGSGLEAAGPQLLGISKLELGKELIRVFCIPGKYQAESGSQAFNDQVVRDNLGLWTDFKHYCRVDSGISYTLVNQYLEQLTAREMDYQAITMEMNVEGWPTDRALIEEMYARYLENQATALHHFIDAHNAGSLNLNSPKQVSEWCAERGIKSKSFDKQRVASMLERLTKKLDTMTNADPKWQGYVEVLALLHTKQIIGGSSLKKLKVLLDTMGSDNRLRDQYMHIGAGQTWRTTGRSVQMQNLKTIGENPDDVDSLHDPATEWDNQMLAKNIRQCFTASHPQGLLLVGDLKSVESRGLAWLAGEKWKLDAYKQGLDVYKVQATKIYHGLAYDAVTKMERQTGKVGELSCGYGAGPEAVQSFAAGMGITLTEQEAARIVVDWRAANPKTLDLWAVLDMMLHLVVGSKVRQRTHITEEGWAIVLKMVDTPRSLVLQAGHNVQSIVLEVWAPDHSLFMRRWFHGAYVHGRNIRYYRATDRKTGDLWKDTFTDPKTGQLRHWELYGGKLAGILTQSFCREIFMGVLKQIHKWASWFDNTTLIGQFHDEAVVDWRPASAGMANAATYINVNRAKSELEQLMSDPGPVLGFPLAADIKSDYRYTK